MSDIVERLRWRAHDGIRPMGETDRLTMLEAAAEITHLRAALSAPPPVVPAGWRLVPVEPTPEMLVAINWPNDPAGYRAMLAAAPQAPTGGAE